MTSVSVEVDLHELVAELSTADRKLLVEILEKEGVDVGTLSGDAITPEVAYYAFANGDMETVRRFVCEAAGRIA